jgi:hypothetical protein
MVKSDDQRFMLLAFQHSTQSDLLAKITHFAPPQVRE